MSEPLVIVGNGMAATRLVEELASRALGRYAVAVIGAEPMLAYNRVLLSSLLAREVEAHEIELKPRSWWRAKGVTLVYGRHAIGIDLAGRAVRLEGRVRIPFSKLVLATGSTPVRLEMPGIERHGVLTFRNRADVDAMLRRTRAGTAAAVIGGGLLGLEAAYGLQRAGADVTVVHLMDRLMERQLDARAGALLKASLEERGIRVLLSAATGAIEGGGHVERVRLKDGRIIAAEMVVVAAGIRPNADLARGAGIRCNRGVVVDDGLETSEPGVFAIGECAEHRGQCYGLVEPAYQQARALAARLSGRDARYQGSVLATHLKVSGIDVFSAGDFLGAPGSEAIVLSDPGRRAYRKVVLKDRRLAGALLYGDTADGHWYLDLIRTGADVERLRPGLVFGRALAEAA